MCERCEKMEARLHQLSSELEEYRSLRVLWKDVPVVERGLRLLRACGGVVTDDAMRRFGIGKPSYVAERLRKAGHKIVRVSGVGYRLG